MQLSDIVEYQNFFSPTDFLSITRSISNKPWYWGHVSHPKQSQGLPPFWQMPLNDDKFFTNYLLNKIEENTGIGYDLERVYANGQTYGMRGSIHQDGFDESCRTLWNPPQQSRDCYLLWRHFLMLLATALATAPCEAVPPRFGSGFQVLLLY